MFVRIPLRRAMMGAVLAMLAGAAGAQTGDWPNRPIRLVVAGPAGAGMDIYARLLAAPLQAALKTSIVVDNKAGITALVGNDAVAKAAPDGYTLLFALVGGRDQSDRRRQDALRRSRTCCRWRRSAPAAFC
jgi:tripartite-type tricarboxylate transporter receptor subunit TctC